MTELAVIPRLPWRERDLKSDDPQQGVDYLRDLVKTLQKALDEIRRVVNVNAIAFKAQDDQPTPYRGQLIVWKDTDASSGSPTHYLVYNDGSDTVTFASEEVA
jgi:hypothetical protein